MKFICLFICIVVFTQCKNHTKNKPEIAQSSNEIIEINIEELDAKKNISYSSVFKSIKLLPLETNDDCLIGSIDKIVIHNDIVFVLDKRIGKALFLFNLDGRFIRKIGSVGKGSGEYMSPSSFTIDTENDQILILDRMKILVFSFDGKLMKELPIERRNAPFSIENLNGVTYVNHLPNTQSENSFMLSALDENGHLMKTWLSTDTYSKGFRQQFVTGNQLFKAKDNIKYCKQFMDTIFSVQNLQVKPYITLVSDNAITTKEISEVNKIRNPRELSDYFMKTRRFLGASNYIESPSLIMFRFQNEGVTNSLFYWKNSGTIDCTEYLFHDDLSLIDYKTFYSTHENYFISCIDNKGENLQTFFENIKNGEIKIPKIELEKIRGLTPNSNPIVVLYECRESAENIN